MQGDYPYSKSNPYLSTLKWDTEQSYRSLLKLWMEYPEHRLHGTFKLKNGIWDSSFEGLEILMSNFLGTPTKVKPRGKSQILEKKKKKKKKKGPSKSELSKIRMRDNAKRVLERVRFYYIQTYWVNVKDPIIRFFLNNYKDIIYKNVPPNSQQLQMIHEKTFFCVPTIMSILKYIRARIKKKQ